MIPTVVCKMQSLGYVYVKLPWTVKQQNQKNTGLWRKDTERKTGCPKLL